MNITLTDIETFLSVLDAGSISGAAARADLSKSVVSKRISEFETALGTSLFLRSAGRIVPTDAAFALAERLRPALAELVAATESAAAETDLRGRLAISAPMSFGIRHLGPVIADFAHRHPNLDIVLDYDDRMVDLARAGFDVGLRIGAMHDSTLMSRKLCEDPRALVASPGYLRQAPPLERPEDLAAHVALSYRHSRLGEVWSFSEPVALPRPARVSANNGDAIRDLAIGGLGLALLPLFICHEALASGALVRVLPELTPQPVPITIVWPPIRPMPRKLRLFIDHLVTSLGTGQPWSTP